MKPLVLDLSKPRPAHAGPAQQALCTLQPGNEYVHDHNGYRTSFGVWIAQQRMRLGMPFKYRKLGDGRFSIFLESECLQTA